MKKNWKRFFTLSRAAEGFTLVELIVVIAILAILAGVAVPAYSGYITKANKQSDLTLISDIEYALTLAGYSGTLAEGEGGYILLSVDGIINADAIADGSSLDNALVSAFGTNYKNTLKLKYDSWGNNRLYLGLAGGQAEAVYNSTYYDVSDVLMGQVKDITDAALSILEITGDNRTEMINLFGEEFMGEVASIYGYESLDSVSDDEFANFMVLAVAFDITNAKQSGSDVSQASGLIQNFALYNGYAATAEGKADGFDEAYDTFVSSLSTANGDISEIADAYKTLQAAANASSNYGTYAVGQGKTDQEAFGAMMNGLTGATTDGNAALVRGDLANGDFFTTGVGNTLFGTYMDSVESFVGVSFTDDTALGEFRNAMAEPGVVGIYYTNLGSYVVVNNSLPVE